jgi:hypothetical protein
MTNPNKYRVNFGVLRWGYENLIRLSRLKL